MYIYIYTYTANFLDLRLIFLKHAENNNKEKNRSLMDHEVLKLVDGLPYDSPAISSLMFVLFFNPCFSASFFFLYVPNSISSPK